jgi:hypothetical protein
VVVGFEAGHQTTVRPPELVIRLWVVPVTGLTATEACAICCGLRFFPWLHVSPVRDWRKEVKSFLRSAFLYAADF